MTSAASDQPLHGQEDWLTAIVRIFLESKLSIILIVFSLLLGIGALLVTPREEDPQIVVPLADVFVTFPGHSASDVERLVATPLERLLFQIDGVEYVYSMSRENLAIVTVRFYVGQDRERSLVKLFKKINENLDIIPPGVSGWVVKPVEIDDVPIVTLTLAPKESSDSRQSDTRSADSFLLRRVGEEVVQRLAVIPEISRAYAIGGEPREVRVELDLDRLQAYQLTPLEVRRAITASNASIPGGEFTRNDVAFRVLAGTGFTRPDQLPNLVVGVFDDRPVFLKDVATLRDGPAEVANYVRHGWGPARGFAAHHGSPGTLLGAGLHAEAGQEHASPTEPYPAVTLAFAKKKGTNAVTLAATLLKEAEQLRRDRVIPDDVDIIITRNYGLTADEKVNELVEHLGLAILIVLALLTLAMGWRAAFVVAIAIPVVFGLTLAVNLLFGYTINRVTLFALIVALGLLVDDPIVDVENIERHFEMRRTASPRIVLEAVAEIRPPLISATLAVIVSFLPLFFITGMMGPYMAPMALNVPVSMVMSMVVAFTITPWLSYHVLKGQFGHGPHAGPPVGTEKDHNVAEVYDPEAVKQTFLYRLFRPIMAPLLSSRLRAALFLGVMAALTIAAVALAATRSVPLKMLPYDNKNEFLLVLDLDEGTTLERTDAAVREFERYLAQVPEVTDFTSYVGVPGPIDFNGLVRHYYLRQAPHLAEIRVNLAPKKARRQQSHGIGLRVRDDLTALAQRHQAKLKIVEIPPGPPVLASVVAEVYGRPDHSYDDLLAAAETVAARMNREPGLADVDDIREAPQRKLIFVPDQEKAALHGVSVADIAETLRIGLDGTRNDLLRLEDERNPLRIVVRLPRVSRSSAADLSRLVVKGRTGHVVPLAELGQWQTMRVDQTIYHKNLERVVYVLAETAGRPPAECIVDMMADRLAEPDTDARNASGIERVGSGWLSSASPRPVAQRTYFRNGSGIAWAVPEGIRVEFAGEGEWDITLDVFRDLGLAFGAALVMIYIILVAQTKSFLIPVIVMLAIPLTLLGVMPGFWLLNAVAGQTVGGYADPVYFTATAMIGMIALAGIVTRDSIILVDFIELAVHRGRTLFDAIMESRVVRLRPILLTAGAATLASIPITLDPIFSGLGWSIIFGLVASTLFTLFVIPVTYWLLYAGRKP
ncbi:MAG: efflux RND transporter permease subunit [Gemmatales bacterium]|nr:efflux RND transporter permease subunit [Gemmatales bacterium]MDW8387235.1 efflux RND transporter permease subunit [Gemmatales bacterium]